MKQLLLILLLSLLFSGVFFVNTGRTLIGDGGDNYEYFGFMHLTRENLASFKHPFAETDILRYPAGFDYSYGFDGVFAIITGALLSFFAPPILAYNLTLTIIIFLNIVLSYFSFKRLGLQEGVEDNLKIKALISALIFGSSPYVFARLNGHLNLAFVAGFPFLLTQLVILNNKIVHKPTEINALDLNLTILSALLVLFGSLQYLILLALVLPFLLIFAYQKGTLPRYKEFYNEHEKKIILAVVYFYGIFFLFYWGYFRAAFTGSLVYIEGIEKYFAPHILDILVPNKYLGEFWVYFNPSDFSIERVITIGTVEIVLLFWLLAVSKRNRLRLLGIFLIILYLVLSFGLFKIPFYPEGGRITVLLSLYTAALFLLESGNLKKQELLGLIFSMLVIERLFFNLHSSYPPFSQTLNEKIGPLQGEAVLNIPLSKYDTYRSALPVFYEKKIMDGYFHYTAANERAERLLEDEIFARFICNLEREDEPSYTYREEDRIRLYDALRRMDVGAITLFKDEEVGKFYWEDCSNVRDWWYWINPDTLVLNKDTDVVIRHSFEMAEDNPHTIAQIYFERDGRFVMDGAFITPKGLKDWSLVMPGGEVIRPELEDVEGGYQITLDPALETQVKAGQSLRIISGNEVDFSRYISIFYLFEENKSSLERKRVLFEKIHDERELEIYRLNY